MEFSIYVVEGQPVSLVGLEQVLGSVDGCHFVGSSGELAPALQFALMNTPDVLLISQPCNERSILTSLTLTRQASLQSKVVAWVNDISEPDILRALHLGAKGVLRKTAPIPTLVNCLRQVASGSVSIQSDRVTEGLRRASNLAGPRITPRERQVIELVCRGCKNREIAVLLSITPGTVKVHLMHIFEKVGVKDRIQLALQGQQLLKEIPTLGNHSHE